MAPKKNKVVKARPKNYVIKAIRFPSTKLVDWITNATRKATGGNRNAFVSRAAERLAIAVLAGELPLKEHSLPKNHLPRAIDAESTLRTNVMIPPDLMPLIEEASRRLNHHVSPFLAWATLLEARRVLKKYPKVSKRPKAAGAKGKRGSRLTTMTVRFPLATIDLMDEWCESGEKKRSRSDFLEEAVYYVIQERMVDANVIDLLPEDHSLNGGKKMVSFRIGTSLRNDADAAGAVMNHSCTGFLVFASLVYLNDHQ